MHLLEGESGLYVVQVGTVDDQAIIWRVERWAALRRRYVGRQCMAVVVAERVEPRYLNVLAAISRAVPLIVIEVREENGGVRLRQIELR